MIKNFNEFVNENKNGAQFKHSAKYSNEDFESWLKVAKKDKLIEIIKDGDISVIFLSDKHIATYVHKHEIIMGDDLDIFGK